MMMAEIDWVMKVATKAMLAMVREREECFLVSGGGGIR